jgi:hypothetical protein
MLRFGLNKKKMIVKGFEKSGPTIRLRLNSRPRGGFYPDPMRVRGVVA